MCFSWSLKRSVGHFGSVDLGLVSVGSALDSFSNARLLLLLVRCFGKRRSRLERLQIGLDDLDIVRNLVLSRNRSESRDHVARFGVEGLFIFVDVGAVLITSLQMTVNKLLNSNA